MMATTRARSKPRQEFKDLFRIEATKEEIQSDVLKMIEGLEKLAEMSKRDTAVVETYEPLLKVADAIRAEAEESPQGKRTRKRKRLFEIEKKATRRRRAMRATFPAGQSTCQKEVFVES